MFKKCIKIFSFIILLASCTPYKPAQVVALNYRIENQKKIDTAMLLLIAPYKDSLDKTMNNVIGFSLSGLTKKQPESGLGNFMADAMKQMAQQTYGKTIDAAFVNYGGVRSYLPKGDITVGKIFELMPFDNLIVLQDMSGKTLQAFLNHVASRGGWPMSKGITFGIKDKLAVNVLVDGKPIDDNASYTIANSDYVANGGDNSEMLKKLPQQNKFYLLRDALLEYTKQLTNEGKTIDSKPENRIVYAQ